VFNYLPGTTTMPMTLPPSTYPWMSTPQPHGCSGCCRCCRYCRHWEYVFGPQTTYRATITFIADEEASSDDEE
jgi:hypothetical protein